jgi:protein involved in polysaccharide export with SLBB domain
MVMFLLQPVCAQSIGSKMIPPNMDASTEIKKKQTYLLPDIQPEMVASKNSNNSGNHSKFAIQKVENNSKLTKVQKLSTIENLYKQHNLKQFGYEIFNRSDFYVLSSTISPEYTLNIGDKVKVYLWGEAIDFLGMAGNQSVQPVIDTMVDREGNLFIPGIGAVPAKGRSITDIQRELYMMMSQKYSNFDLKMTVAQPRDFPVMVMGNVSNPGTVYLSSSSSILDALNFAGGITKDGSLRKLVYVDSSKGINVDIDLYDLIIGGKYQNIYLKEGDIILVKPIGDVVAIAEGVKMPAIYEYKEGETLKDIIEYAGGLLPSANTDKLIIESYNQSLKEKTVEQYDLHTLASVRTQNGDLIKIKDIFDKAENIIKLEGHIKHPGEFEYFDGIRLSDVIQSSDDLKTQTFTDQILIERIQGTNKEIILVPVSLEDFFNGLTDPELQPQDVIKVYAATEMPTLEVAGEIINPGLIPYRKGLTLRELLAAVNLSVNPNDVVIEISNNVFESVKSNYNEEILQYKNMNSSEMKDIEEENITYKIDEKGAPVFEAKVTSYYLYDVLTKNRNLLSTSLLPYDKILFRKVKEEEALKTVSVSGYVKNPGVYRVKPGLTLKEILQLSGGLDPQGYLKGMLFIRPSVGELQSDAMKATVLRLQEDIATMFETAQRVSGESEIANMEDFINSQLQLLNIIREKAAAKYGRIVLDIEENDINSLDQYQDLEILDGDEIYIPPLPQFIIVLGEVYNPSAVAFRPDKNTRYYIDKVGGMTDKAKKKDIYVIKANGVVEKPAVTKQLVLEPGDSVIVPRKVKLPLNIRGIIKDIAQIGANAASTVFILTKL